MERPVIRTAIVDDEAPARQRVRQLLASEADIEIVGEYCSGSAALRELPATHPDLVFLGVAMARVTGFDVLQGFRDSGLPQPLVVFVTALDQYAVRAFDENAVDYLLEPFDDERFSRTVERIHERIASRNRGTQEGLHNGHFTRLAVRTGGHIEFVRIGEIDWITSEENYLRLHVGTKSYLFRGTIRGVETRLDPTLFVRISRSTIVNVDRIAGLQASFQRDHIVYLIDGTRLRMLAPYRSRLDAAVAGL